MKPLFDDIVCFYLDFFKFLLKPSPRINKESFSFLSFIFLFWVIIVEVLISYLIRIPADIIYSSGYGKSFVVSFMKTSIENPTFLFILSIVVFRPLIEEMESRLPLTYNTYYFFISFALRYYAYFVYLKYFMLLHMVVIIVAFCFFTFVCLFRNSAESIYNQYYYIIFYAQVLLFTALHFNYQAFEWYELFFLPFFWLYIMWGALIFSYVRVRYSIWFAILCHAYHNAFVLILYYSLSS